MNLSKREIDKLGDNIRNEQNNLSDYNLNLLQAYRISHKEALSNAFSMLCRITRKQSPSAIVTYRVKRFESIISKLQRIPEMRFSRMGDIGGCRCILNYNADVYKIRDLISKEEQFEIIKETDYIKCPQEGGYKSLHLYLKDNISGKTIEVQLRNQIDHNWSTLVEITDVLLELKIKELGNNKDLFRLHFLLSRINELNIKEKNEIVKIVNKYKYYEKLSEVFARNYIKVRRQWFEIESQSKRKYFLIETTKDDAPKISSFTNSLEAEDAYFNVYKTSQNANIVLTHLQSPSYNQISISYSNYILTFHDFLTEYFDILESLIIDSLSNRKYLEYYKHLTVYYNLTSDHVKNLVNEMLEIENYKSYGDYNRKRDKKKEHEWRIDINRQVTLRKQRTKGMRSKYQKSLPTTILGKLIVNNITKIIERKYRKKMRRLLESSKK